MRVTFVLHSPMLSGGIRVIAIYAAGLRRLGHEVTIVTPPHKLRVRLRELRSGHFLLRNTDFGHSLFEGLDVQWNILDRWRPVTDADVPEGDVVIASYWPTVAWVDALSASKGRKVFFAQHYEVAEGGSNPDIDAAWRRPLYKIVICNWMLKICTEKFGDSRVSLVPNSVDTTQFDAPPRDKQSVPAAGLLYYDASPLKGCDVSLEAVRQSRQQFGELRLIAFGKTIGSKLPLPKDTHYECQPSQSRIREIYASVDMWLWGSRVEGFGLPVLEAMACRTPVISTPAGASPEILACGGGFLVPMERPDAMAEAIGRIRTMPNAAWRSLSDAAYATVRQGTWVEGAQGGYTWNDAAGLFEQALRRAIDSPPTH